MKWRDHLILLLGASSPFVGHQATAAPAIDEATAGADPKSGERTSFTQAEIRAIVRRVQTALMVRGYNPDGIDGVLGDNTQIALRPSTATPSAWEQADGLQLFNLGCRRCLVDREASAVDRSSHP